MTTESGVFNVTSTVNTRLSLRYEVFLAPEVEIHRWVFITVTENYSIAAAGGPRQQAASPGTRLDGAALRVPASRYEVNIFGAVRLLALIVPISKLRRVAVGYRGRPWLMQ